MGGRRGRDSSSDSPVSPSLREKEEEKLEFPLENRGTEEGGGPEERGEEEKVAEKEEEEEKLFFLRETSSAGTFTVQSLLSAQPKTTEKEMREDEEGRGKEGRGGRTLA